MIKEESRLQKDTLFEGIVSVRALLESYAARINDRRITRILYDASRRQEKELAWLRHRADEYGFSLESVSSTELEQITVGSTHGGIVAYAAERTFPPLSDKILSSPLEGLYVMLEGIEDPYNFGYAIRSLYAAGTAGIVLSPRNWMSAAGIVCRASAGASERIPIYSAESASDAAAFFRGKGCSVVCADLRDSVSVFDADIGLPAFLIVGGEKRGISRTLLEQADLRVKIDYGREFPQALSAASAASVIAFEIFRKNRKP